MKYRKICCVVLVLAVVFFSSCTDSAMRDYYAEKDNYVNATGTVTHISCNPETRSIYIGFSDLNPEFDDNSFKIVGDNYSIVQEKDIQNKIHVGDQLRFITAPKYWGDGYVIPIVAVTVNGEVLLDFEEGLSNYLKWLADT